MVFREDIQRLIHRPRTGGRIVSVFLDMAVNSDNKRTYGVFLAKQKARFPELDSDRDSHHRDALGEAFARIERWIEDNFDEANKGLALYTELGGRWIDGLQVGTSLQNRLEIDERPVVGPLAEIVESQPRYAVFLVDGDGLRMFGLRSAQILLERTVAAPALPAPAGVQAGGFAQPGFQRRKQQERRNFFKDFARDAEEFAQRFRADDIVLLGTEENVNLFLPLLPSALRSRIVHTGPAPADDRASELVERLRPFFERRALEDETRTVRILEDRVRNHHYAAAGLQQTLEQLQQGKVDTLIVARELRGSGGECGQCGFYLARHDGICPYCGGAVRDGVDIAEAMIRLAEEQEIAVEFVNRQELSSFEGAGALLKF